MVMKSWKVHYNWIWVKERNSCKVLCTGYWSELLENDNNGLIADTDELQEFFSDFHSNPAVLYIPLLHNHYKWGRPIIVKLNRLT